MASNLDIPTYTPTRSPAEIQDDLLVLANVTDKTRRTEFWKSLLKELDLFDDYCCNTFDLVKSILYRIISDLGFADVSHYVLEKQADSVSEFLVEFNTFLGDGFKFFLHLLTTFESQTEDGKPPRQVREFIFTKKFTTLGFGDFVVMLSDIYYSVKEIKIDRRRSKGSWVPPSSFIRSTEKFWVRLEDCTKLKLAIVKHLPCLRFGKSQGVLGLKETEGPVKTGTAHLNNGYDNKGGGDAAPIWSVYFDNDELRLYHDKIRSREGATLIRIRGYGEESTATQVFIERKTWHDSWVQNQSIKERFNLSYSKVLDFLSGQLTPMDLVQDMKKKKGLDNQAAGEMLGLAQGIYDRIRKLNLRPALRTCYARTAFQHTSSNSIRISLDTSLDIVREEVDPGPGRWCRDFSVPIDPSDRFLFPLAILEVKLSGVESPSWLNRIIQSSYVVPAYKFSKFIHGQSKLQTTNCRVLPRWFNRPIVHLPGTSLLHWYTQQNNLVIRKDLEMEEPDAEKPLPTLKQFAQQLLEPKPPEPPKVTFNQGIDIISSLRIEPKTFFANERTLFRWITTGLALGFAASAVVGVSVGNNALTGQQVGATFYAAVFLAIFCGLFLGGAVVVYQYRVSMMNRRLGARSAYDDKYLLTIFTFIFVCALGGGLYLQLGPGATIPPAIIPTYVRIYNLEIQPEYLPQIGGTSEPFLKALLSQSAFINYTFIGQLNELSKQIETITVYDSNISCALYNASRMMHLTQINSGDFTLHSFSMEDKFHDSMIKRFPLQQFEREEIIHPPYNYFSKLSASLPTKLEEVPRIQSISKLWKWSRLWDNIKPAYKWTLPIHNFGTYQQLTYGNVTFTFGESNHEGIFYITLWKDSSTNPPTPIYGIFSFVHTRPQGDDFSRDYLRQAREIYTTLQSMPQFNGTRTPDFIRSIFLIPQNCITPPNPDDRLDN